MNLPTNYERNVVRDSAITKHFQRPNLVFYVSPINLIQTKSIWIC